MNFDIEIELRALTNPYACDQWEQLYDVLELKSGRVTEDSKRVLTEIMEDVAEIILNLHDIAALLDETVP